MSDTKIVVTQRPKDCRECMFSHAFGYDRYCEITHVPFDRHDIPAGRDDLKENEFSHSYYDYTTPETCPLVAISELNIALLSN